MSANSSPKPHLLDLSTLEPERPTIRIDGAPYELAVLDDFGVLEQARLSRLQTRVQRIITGGLDPSEENAQVLAGALDELVSMVLPCLPAEVRGKLRDGQKAKLCEVFFQASRVIPAPERDPESTGEPSSLDSNDSTEAGPATG